MFAARTTHSYTNQISATLYLFPCVHMPLTPPHLPLLSRPCSGRARLEDVASSNSLSASSTPAKFVVVSCPCSSRCVCSFARVLLGSFSAQAQQQRQRCASPRSSWSGFVFIFGRTVFGLGLLCLSVRDFCFWFNTPYFVLTVLLCASRAWTPNPVFGRPPHRPDPAPLRPGHFFWCSTWARTAGAAAPPALKARKQTFDRAPWTYPRTFRLLHTLLRGGLTM